MNRIFFVALAIFTMSPMTVKSDERIYETKNVCGRYYASEINSVEVSILLGLKGFASVG